MFVLLFLCLLCKIATLNGFLISCGRLWRMLCDGIVGEFGGWAEFQCQPSSWTVTSYWLTTGYRMTPQEIRSFSQFKNKQIFSVYSFFLSSIYYYFFNRNSDPLNIKVILKYLESLNIFYNEWNFHKTVSEERVLSTGSVFLGAK